MSGGAGVNVLHRGYMREDMLARSATNKQGIDRSKVKNGNENVNSVNAAMS